MRRLFFSLFSLLVFTSTVAGADAQPEEVKVFLSSKQTLGTVRFAEDSAALNALARKEIDRIVLQLREAQGSRQIVRIEGFAGRAGTDESNVPLSMMRAKAVVDYMRKRHNLGSNFYLTGYGNKVDGVSTSEEKGRAEIAVYDATWDFDQVVVEKSVLR